MSTKAPTRCTCDSTDSTIAESEEVSPGIVLDYSDSGEVVGVEVLHLSRRSSKVKLSTLEFEVA